MKEEERSRCTGEECGQCINYTTGWLSIPSVPIVLRVPIVCESPRVYTNSCNTYVYGKMHACVRACVRLCVTRGDLHSFVHTYLRQPRNTCSRLAMWAQDCDAMFDIRLIKLILIEICGRISRENGRRSLDGWWKIWHDRSEWHDYKRRDLLFELNQMFHL